MVYFVGAGAGDAELLTIKGAKILSRADTVIWAGSLVNPDVLLNCKKDAKIFDSSKMTLFETTNVLCNAEKNGELSVRLHTGDPSLYGAIAEQIAELKKREIPFKIVPGVSSLFGAAASLGVEFTIPTVSQSLIISRISGQTPVPERENLCELSKSGASLAIFLSASRIFDVVKEILAGGTFTQKTPAAVVYRATWADEKIIRGTLFDIAQKTQDAKIEKQAIIFVGDFLNQRGEKSRLYDENFSTSFRKSKNNEENRF